VIHPAIDHALDLALVDDPSAVPAPVAFSAALAPRSHRVARPSGAADLSRVPIARLRAELARFRAELERHRAEIERRAQKRRGRSRRNDSRRFDEDFFLVAAPLVDIVLTLDPEEAP
jgi:hypothetical protein